MKLVCIRQRNVALNIVTQSRQNTGVMRGEMTSPGQWSERCARSSLAMSTRERGTCNLRRRGSCITSGNTGRKSVIIVILSTGGRLPPPGGIIAPPPERRGQSVGSNGLRLCALSLMLLLSAAVHFHRVHITEDHAKQCQYANLPSSSFSLNNPQMHDR